MAYAPQGVFDPRYSVEDSPRLFRPNAFDALPFLATKWPEGKFPQDNQVVVILARQRLDELNRGLNDNKYRRALLAAGVTSGGIGSLSVAASLNTSAPANFTLKAAVAAKSAGTSVAVLGFAAVGVVATAYGAYQIVTWYFSEPLSQEDIERQLQALRRQLKVVTDELTEKNAEIEALTHQVADLQQKKRDERSAALDNLEESVSALISQKDQKIKNLGRRVAKLQGHIDDLSEMLKKYMQKNSVQKFIEEFLVAEKNPADLQRFKEKCQDELKKHK
ncbi:MAG: hypothetical protein HY069_00105 [Chlamydiia bacterium]|nr:hypothetical protein [Chlamydiia bacterium]